MLLLLFPWLRLAGSCLFWRPRRGVTPSASAEIVIIEMGSEGVSAPITFCSYCFPCMLVLLWSVSLCMCKAGEPDEAVHTTPPSNIESEQPEFISSWVAELMQAGTDLNKRPRTQVIKLALHSSREVALMCSGVSKSIRVHCWEDSSSPYWITKFVKFNQRIPLVFHLFYLY